MADQKAGLAATALAKLVRGRQRSLVVRSAVERVDHAALERYVAGLGEDAATVRNLDAAVDDAMASVQSLSSLTAPLALDYLDRLARPIPALTPQTGVQIVSRAYVAHLVVEADPAAFGAADIPVLGTLPPLRRGSPPQDLLTRVVKATRRNFEVIRALSSPGMERVRSEPDSPGARPDLRPRPRGPDGVGRRRRTGPIRMGAAPGGPALWAGA